MSELFCERYELLQVYHGVVLNHPGYFGKSIKSVENVRSVSRNEPKQLRRIFCLKVALTIYMGKEISFEARVNCFGRDLSFCK